MNKSNQELLQTARQKLDEAQCPPDQCEHILRTLDLLLELAPGAPFDGAQSALVTSVVEHHTLLAIIDQQIEELDALKRISYNLTSSLEMQVILDAIATEAMHLIKNAQGVHIFHYQDSILTFGASLDSQTNRNLMISTPRPEGLTYSVARGRQVIVIDDMTNHSLYEGMPQNWGGSIVGIPLMIGENVVGVMNMARWQVGGFNRAELRLLELLADQAALAIMNARLHEVVANQALSDSLTGLPNRRALDVRLEEDVQRTSRYGRSFSIIMMDLDGFKFVNDTFGHSIGDQILRQYAQFISATRRASDFLARYGGDELIMILPETDLPAARQVANHIKERVSGFVITLPDGNHHRLNVSGGIAVFPLHAKTASDLLRAADEALYRAKRRSRGSFLVALESKPKQSS